MKLPQRRSEAAAQRIRDHIAAELSVGDKLPSEEDLAVMTGVSRMTVREALHQLWLEGRISRRWGAGTFVRRAGDESGRVVQTLLDVHPISSLPESLRALGRDVTVTDATLCEVAADAATAAGLGLAEGTSCWEVVRVLVIDDRPGMHMRDFIPKVFDGVATDVHALRDGTKALHQLARAWNVPVERMEGEIEGALADAPLSAALDVPVGSALLRVRQRALTVDERVVAYSDLCQRTDVIGWQLVRTIDR